MKESGELVCRVQGANEMICTLPSSETMCRIIAGDPTALPLMFRDLALRGFLVSVGIFAAGERNVMRGIGYGMGGAAGIEAFVIAYSWWINRGRTPPQVWPASGLSHM